MVEVESVPVLVITGPVGVGKTSVAAEIGRRLAAAAVPHAVVDADALRGYAPKPADDPFGERVGLRNLAAVWAVFREAGAARLVLADVVGVTDRIEAYRTAVPGAAVVVVRLLAGPVTLETRLRRREITPDLAWYLRRAPELVGIMERAGIGDVLVATDGRSVGEVAEEILARSGWLDPTVFPTVAGAGSSSP